MKKAEVVIGRVYVAKVSGVLTSVRVTSESPYGGWNATNLKTGREIRIRGAARLRREIVTKPEAAEAAAARREDSGEAPPPHPLAGLVPPLKGQP